MLLEHFTQGTKGTITGRRVGLEVETDFVEISTGHPISLETNRKIFATGNPWPKDVAMYRELGRQKIELAVGPCNSPQELLVRAHESLNWLYRVAEQQGARPVFKSDIGTNENLLMVVEPRDQLWAALDGEMSLEELCRCSSVQFTVDVHPEDATEILNRLWSARLHEIDYAENNAHWQKYITTSHFRYRADRYAGPGHFESLADYAHKLNMHEVAMHNGQPVRLVAEETPDLNMELFLRSIWWHYRLRRYGETLTVEIRPFARRGDDCLKGVLEQDGASFWPLGLAAGTKTLIVHHNTKHNLNTIQNQLLLSQLETP
jgi:hypothetical protein